MHRKAEEKLVMIFLPLFYVLKAVLSLILKGKV